MFGHLGAHSDYSQFAHPGDNAQHWPNAMNYLDSMWKLMCEGVSHTAPSSLGKLHLQELKETVARNSRCLRQLRESRIDISPAAQAARFAARTGGLGEAKRLSHPRSRHCDARFNPASLVRAQPGWTLLHGSQGQCRLAPLENQPPAMLCAGKLGIMRNPLSPLLQIHARSDPARTGKHSLRRA